MNVITALQEVKGNKSWWQRTVAKEAARKNRDSAHLSVGMGLVKQ